MGKAAVVHSEETEVDMVETEEVVDSVVLIEVDSAEKAVEAVDIGVLIEVDIAVTEEVNSEEAIEVEEEETDHQEEEEEETKEEDTVVTILIIESLKKKFINPFI